MGKSRALSVLGACAENLSVFDVDVDVVDVDVVDVDVFFVVG